MLATKVGVTVLIRYCMKLKPYPFQQVAIDHAVTFLRDAAPDTRTLYAAPTGSGKSVIELCVHEAFDDSWIVTPRDEILYGMADKLGMPDDADPLDYRMCTPVKLRNRLLSGAVRAPGRYIYDETHHHEANTWQQLDLLSGCAPAVGYTATPYRGSPRSTREFRERWGDPVWIITYEEAVREGIIRMPTFEVLPLVDDDVVEVRGGEFDITSIDGATVDRLGDLADHSAQWYNKTTHLWDRPTIYALPSSISCNRLHAELAKRGIPSVTVSAQTPKRERVPIFEAVTNRVFALLHINIVSEGVDLPLRRFVDLAPTLSPVNWVQKLGRITRPCDGPPPEYICTNRNIMRHAYVLEGVVPVSAAVATEKAFGPTERAHSRVLGLEALGRFKPTTAKLMCGANLYIYALSVPIGTVVMEYCVLVHPTMEPIWAVKVNQRAEDGTKTYGSWVRCDNPPDDVRGFSSIGPKQVSEKQAKWWDRAAHRHGLDPEQEVTRKNFQALPVLSDLGLRLT